MKHYHRAALLSVLLPVGLRGQHVSVTERSDSTILIDTDRYGLVIRPVAGYVTGVVARSFVDKQTGARSLGFGLDILDFLCETRPENAKLDDVPYEPPYAARDRYWQRSRQIHGEGPQLCTQAKKLEYAVYRGDGWVAVKQWKLNEGFCHQRGYICMIFQFGRVPVLPRDSFSMLNIIGYFDSIEEMQQVYDRYKGYASILPLERAVLLSEGVLEAGDPNERFGAGTSFVVKPWGLAPDRLTDGEWHVVEHEPHWTLGGAAGRGIDSNDKVAGHNSRWWTARAEGGSATTWAGWTMPRACFDLAIFDRVVFSCKVDRPEAVERVWFEARQAEENKRMRWDLATKPARAWQRLDVALRRPTTGQFNLMYTGSFQVALETNGPVKVWLDDLRFVRPGNGQERSRVAVAAWSSDAQREASVGDRCREGDLDVFAVPTGATAAVR